MSKNRILAVASMVTMAMAAFCAPVAWAGVDVTIRVGAYDRSYLINFQPARWYGDNTFNLNVGRHGFSTDSGATFQFDVLADGRVQSLNTQAATGGNGVLDLNLVSIRVDSSEYGRIYKFPMSPIIRESKDVLVIPGLVEKLTNSVAEIVRFQTNAAGEIAVLSGAKGVQVSNGLIRLLSVEAEIDPGKYDRLWQFTSQTWTRGRQTVRMIPGVDEDVYTPRGGLIGRFRVSSAGKVEVRQGAKSMEAQGNTLRFRNVAVKVASLHDTVAFWFYGGPGAYVQGETVAIPYVKDLFQFGPWQTEAAGEVAFMATENAIYIDEMSGDPLTWQAPGKSSAFAFSLGREIPSGLIDNEGLEQSQGSPMAASGCVNNAHAGTGGSSPAGMVFDPLFLALFMVMARVTARKFSASTRRAG